MNARGVSLLLLAALLSTAPALAQRGPKVAPQARQRVMLLQQIHQQFMRQARNRMGLTPAQFPRFQRVVVDHAQKRAPLELEQDRLRLALGEQVRLGNAGNQDSTAKLLDALNATRDKLATADAEQMRELEPILSPVQRAQWQIMQERFRQQVRAAGRQPDSAGSDPQP